MTSHTNNNSQVPHVALCPGAGIGHLVPCLRLASMLATTRTCHVTVVIIRPTLSISEINEITSFFTTNPNITLSEFHAIPCNTNDPTTDDPFLLQYDAISRSAPLLVNHLITTLSPRPAAVFSDLLTSGIIRPLAKLGIPTFTLVFTSARFFSLMLSLLHGPIIKGNDIILPGSAPILADEPPSIMFKYDHVFVRLITTNLVHFPYSKAILTNNFEYMERDSLSALRDGKILKDLPPILTIGPLHRLPESDKGAHFVPWLDNQPANTVVYVCFGSRTRMGKDQIKELGEGLIRSGIRFLWVIKTSIVDKEEKEDLMNLLGEEFFEITKNRGLVLKEWVNQEKVLDHPSIGGFVTHNGWNSVLESTRRGIPLLSWPPGGDQRVNAAAMKDAGMGIWERRWGREGESLITSDEIKDKIKELMTSQELRVSVNKVSYESNKAWQNDGTSSLMFQKMVDMIVKTPKTSS